MISASISGETLLSLEYFCRNKKFLPVNISSVNSLKRQINQTCRPNNVANDINYGEATGQVCYDAVKVDINTPVLKGFLMSLLDVHLF